MLIHYSGLPICLFCNAEAPVYDDELLTRLLNRIDKYNDPKAMIMLGLAYQNGEIGLPKNLKKAEALYKRSYDRGHPEAAYFLANMYHKLIPDKVLEKHYAEEGARRGNTGCMSIVADITLQSGNYKEGIRLFQKGYFDVESGNFDEAARLWMNAARLGDKTAMENVMAWYRDELISNDDLTTTLRAHKAVIAKGKNEAREYAMRHIDFITKREDQTTKYRRLRQKTIQLSAHDSSSNGNDEKKNLNRDPDIGLGVVPITTIIRTDGPTATTTNLLGDDGASPCLMKKEDSHSSMSSLGPLL